MRKFLSVVLIVIAISAQAQQKANYALAARFAPKKLDKMIFSLSVDPHWLKKSDRFWYTYETSEGKKWFIADPVKGEKKMMFDQEKLAAEITRIVKDPFDAQHLGIDSLKFVKDENWVQFEVKSTIDIIKKDTAAKKDSTAKKDSATKKDAKPKTEKKVFYFNYNLITGELVELKDFTKPKRKPNWANISPDSSMIVFGKNYNLWYMDRANYEKALKNEDDSTIVQTQLTTDGVENYSYHGSGAYGGGGETNIDKEKNKDKRKPTGIQWSPDSKHFALVRTDSRAVKDIWVINSIADPRPTLETYKYWMPGEKDAPLDELLLFNMVSKIKKIINAHLYKGQDIGIYSEPRKSNTRDDDWRPSIWLGGNDKFYVNRTNRDMKTSSQCVVFINADSIKTLITESLNTYVEMKDPALINGGKEMIEWSEADGWGHFYLYDENGNLKTQITSGAWHCESIQGVDEKNRVLYFTANGKEKNEDPYYLHLYRVNFDGNGLQLLNAGNFDNNANLNDNNTFFVNTFSRVNTDPQSAVYNAFGKKVMDLETADLASLFAAGYKYPETFKAKADDGITDLYGVMYKPYNFDSTKKYPLIEYVYPGPQTEAVNKSFSKGMDRVDRLAQLGFIVITLGNRGGNPARSKWYHNYGYGNLRNYGLADKKAVAEQLADKYPFIDITKVGIHGHSGGGFMSTAAMLVYPDFFKVAVSNAGNHDNSIYNRWWSETHHGVKEEVSEKGDTSFLYNIDKNPELANNLKGRLLLIHGEIDNNVHPANTMRVVNALIKANKRFDMLILPTQRHGFGDMNEHWFWRTADYFSRWLMGDETERPVDLEEMNREVELKK